MITSIHHFCENGVKRLTDIFKTYTNDLTKIAEMVYGVTDEVYGNGVRDVPTRRYVLRLPPAVSGRADSNHLAIHTKVRFSRCRCTFPFCNPPIWLILPTIQSFRLTTKAEGDTSLRSVSFSQFFSAVVIWKCSGPFCCGSKIKKH